MKSDDFLSLSPQEIIMHIFSFLQAEDLPRIGITSKLMQQLSRDKDLWKHFINRYFPYLKVGQEQEYDNDPKTLFIEEYVRLQKLVKEGS